MKQFSVQNNAENIFFCSLSAVSILLNLSLSFWSWTVCRNFLIKTLSSVLPLSTLRGDNLSFFIQRIFPLIVVLLGMSLSEISTCARLVQKILLLSVDRLWQWKSGLTSFSFFSLWNAGFFFLCITKMDTFVFFDNISHFLLLAMKKLKVGKNF